MREQDWLKYKYPLPVRAMRGQSGDLINGAIYEARGASWATHQDVFAIFLEIRDESGHFRFYPQTAFLPATASANEEHYASDPSQGVFGC